MQAVVFANNISSRVKYIFPTLLNTVGFTVIEFTTDFNHFQNHPGLKINYSSTKIAEEEIWIAPVSLLFESKIKTQNIHCFDLNNKICFFKTIGDFSFDVFAASFYLLTRYEEYFPFKPDFYGRYAHENSLAFQQGFLHQPLINLWLEDLQKLMLQKYSYLQLSSPSFTFIPTYDIDIAYSYRHKGLFRNVGGLLKSIVSGEFSVVRQRLRVLSGREQDPFDSFALLHQIHSDYKISPIYFFLLAEKNKSYDKNILPQKKALRRLVKEHSSKYKTGIHPSWQSGDDTELLAKEIKLLESITNKPVTKSRQHYIRMTLPETYQTLIAIGIKEDYSMGYGSINGFRASYCLPYKWYDLEKEQQTDLTIFPFCFMDANSYFEQGYSAEEALKEMRHYYNIVKQVNGHFITVWHNHFLGIDKMFKGWREIYKKMINEMSEP